MLSKRIVSSIVLLGLFFCAISVDWLFGLLVSVFIIIGLYEFFTMLEKKGISIYKYFGIGMGAIIPLSILLRFELTRSWELFFLVSALIFLIVMQFRRRDNSGVVVAISTTIFGILYVSWFLSFFIKIRYLAGGIGLVLTVILITKLGDIGAYFIGSRFGKTPLIPRISPNKSVEGAVGGLFFSVLGALISNPFLHLKNLELIFLGLFLGILGQLGDLSESLIKRDCQIKDAGSILPGMGGVLDFIDSLLFTVPAFYFLMSVILK
ncbi:MAG: phosphatidate cytidylyltransferase [Candidatus Omnitrophica bacterium]|nr:phosphatidate cytidylyltransferase [Candidatus Omnitrophota bacterium]MDD5592395.1 phosphatidate cytidylyltransferase [Candidatus Omnitrophota bacterium]